MENRDLRTVSNTISTGDPVKNNRSQLSDTTGVLSATSKKWPLLFMIDVPVFLLLMVAWLAGPAQTYPPGTSIRLSSQPIGNHFKHLSAEDGLSENQIKCIRQDRQGFLWFGTADGLNKYDGHTFTVIQHDPNNLDSSLHSNHVLDVYEDRSGKLWVTTVSGIMGGGGGLHQVDKRTGIAKRIRLKSPSVEWTQAQTIHEDRQGILWVGSSAGLIGYNPHTGWYRLYPSPVKNTQVFCSLEDTQNQFWVGTEQGLYRLDRRLGQFTLVPFQSAPAGHQPWVSTLLQDKTGKIWAGTNKDGLLQIKPNGKSVQLVSYAAKKPINRHIFLNAILEDQNGRLLLGTAGELQQVFLRHLPRLSALPENLVGYQKDGRTVVAQMSIDAVEPTGGISSTIDDMAIWMKMLVSMGTLLNNPIEFGRRTSTST